MMSHEIGAIRRLTSQQVREVIRDVQLEQRGTVFHICTDPHEVYEFCFPIKIEQLKQSDIATLADDQLALHEVFSQGAARPVLLPAYDEEMARLAIYIEGVIDRSYAQEALLQAVESPLKLLSILDASYRTGNVMPAVEDSMNSIMAVMLGLVSIGVDRFDQIVSKRLRYLGQIEEPLREYCDAYVQSEVADTIQFKLRDTPLFAGRGRSLQADAEAADCILALNRATEEAYVTQGLERRNIFLFLSSAHRSKVIFELPEVRVELPVIDGEQYVPLRTRAQVFASLVCRRLNEDGSPDYEETLRQLDLMQAVVRELEAIRPFERCATCLIDGGLGSNCGQRERCGGLREVAARVRERRGVMNNLALVQTIQRYAALRRVSDAPQSERRAVYSSFLARVRQDETQQLALRRIKDVYRIVRNKCHFAVRVARGFGATTRYAFLRSGRDVVSAASQYLPMMPNVHGKTYEDLVERIRAFYRHPAHTSSEDLGAIEAVSEEYLQVDARVKEFDSTHELVRCLLYMALPVHDGDEAALQHAIDMIRRFDERPAEFLYIAAWAGRRSRQYQIADDWITTALQRFPDDPRFWHGHALNIYAWIVDGDVQRKCPYSPATAISASTRAVELLSRKQESRHRDDALGANYNNLAFFQILWPETDAYDVAGARSSLERLKAAVPKIDWEPTFPEYYHTEAAVELNEALMLRSEGKGPGLVREKLLAAQREISHAIRMVPEKPSYQLLRDTIVAELRSTA